MARLRIAFTACLILVSVVIVGCRGLEPGATSPGVSGGTNSGGSGSTTSRVEHIYVLTGTATILGYRLDRVTGDLTPLQQQPFQLNGRPRFIVGDAANNRLYALTSGTLSSLGGTVSDGSIVAFTQNAADGSIAKVSETAGRFAMLTLSHDGMNLYASASESIAAFTTTGGNLRPVNGSPFPLGAENDWLTVDSSNRFVLGGPSDGRGNFELQSYRRNADGSLNAAWRQSTDQGVAQIQAHPLLPLAIVSTPAGNIVSSYRIMDDGSLVRIASAPGQGSPVEFVISPSGKFLYVSDDFENVMLGYGIADNGTFSALPGSPYALSDKTSGMAFSVDGNFLLMPHVNSDSLQVAKVEVDGRLTLLKLYSTAHEPMRVAAVK